MTQHQPPIPSASRRAVLLGATAVGVGAALAACSGDDNENENENESGGGKSAGGSAATVAASSIPVGAGTVLQQEQIVVTQPTAGVFKAFSAVCPHQGCLVSSVANGQILCACHNSAFSATDGSPLSGPARRALTAKTVETSGDSLRIS